MTSRAFNVSAAAIWPRHEAGHWRVALAVTLCVAAQPALDIYVTLLTRFAGLLNGNEALATYGIAISGTSAVLGDLFVTALDDMTYRKFSLLPIVSLGGVFGVAVGARSNRVIHLVRRALTAVLVSSFSMTSAAMSTRQTRLQRISKVLRVIIGGTVPVTVVSAPLGCYFGQFISRRETLFCMVPVALVAFVCQRRWSARHSQPT